VKRVALVTGGSRGIGAAVARALAADGADVAVQFYREAEAAEAVVRDCRSFGGVSAEALRADLRDTSSAATMKERLDALGWTVNVVVHCAGVAHYGLLEDTEERDWDDLMKVNLKGAYGLARAFGPAMTWGRWGRFVVLSSVWGQTGAAGEAAYAASKGGLDALAKSLAREWASSSVTVNAVSPGAIGTDMLASLDGEDLAALRAEIPAGRLGRPEDVAGLVRFLVSDEAGYVTGQTIGINGGWRM